MKNSALFYPSFGAVKKYYVKIYIIPWNGKSYLSKKSDKNYIAPKEQ